MIVALVLAALFPAFGLAVPDSTGCPLALADASPLQVCMRLAQLGVVRWGCEETSVVTATWSPPTEGSPVMYYLIEIEMRGAWPDTTVRIPVPDWADWVRGRTAGVDMQGRIGPWPDWNEWFHVERR